jgi:hypothetical protein
MAANGLDPLARYGRVDVLVNNADMVDVVPAVDGGWTAI